MTYGICGGHAAVDTEYGKYLMQYITPVVDCAVSLVLTRV